jgi:hypothetical protein
LFPPAPPPAIIRRSAVITGILGVTESLALLAADVPLAFVATAVNV